MQFHMDLQHRHDGDHHLGDVVDVSGDSLSILVRAHLFRPRQERSFHVHVTYIRVYECARYQPVLHVRITRNDRPGRFPLTLGAPAFLRRSPSSKWPPNYTGYAEDGEGRRFLFLLYIRTNTVKIICFRKCFRQCF